MDNSILLNTQSATEKTDSSNSSHKAEELINYIPVTGTPFTIVKELDKGCYLVMGKYRITEGYQEEEILTKKIAEKDWDILIAVTGILTEAYIEIRDNSTNKQ